MKNADDNILFNENYALKQLLIVRDVEINSSYKVISEKDKKIIYLEQTIAHLKLKYFGSSSERHISPDQPSLFNEAEQLEEIVDNEAIIAEIDAQESIAFNDVVTPQKAAPTRGRVSLPASLPRTIVIHDLPDAEKICACGCSLTEMDSVTSEQIEIIPAKISVIQHCRKKYRCNRCKDRAPITAPLPVQPLPKSNASPSALAYVATAKFLYGLPFYRLENMLQHADYKLPRATQANWMIGAGTLIQPLMNLLAEHQCAGSIMHIDETTVQVLNEKDRSPESKSYFWVAVGGVPGKNVYRFHYNPSRGSAVARDLLEGFNGTVMSDDWSVYGSVCEKLKLAHIACNDHARRKFKDAQKRQPKKSATTKADVALNYFAKLYAIEKRIADKTIAEKIAARIAESVPVWDQFIEWLETHSNRIAPESDFGKALHYTLKLQHKLRHYCTDGALPISNEKAENAIRPFAIARKNFLFFDSPRGAAASANLYSLIMTAKYNNIDPYYYLAYVFKYLPRATTVEEIEKLLPWELTNDVLHADFDRPQ